ncbi:MAG: capsular polysaccharide synthesis protein [Devosia sp.]
MTAASALTRRDFDRFFAAKWRELLIWTFRRERRRNYHDPALLLRLLGEYDTLATLPPAPVPRHIFMLWQQGWDSAPPLVAACAESWRRLNPGWELHLLDDRTYGDFAPSLAQFNLPAGLGRAARANVARLGFLKAHGGVWADATMFATRGLDDWLPQAMGAGVFMFSRPRPYRDVEIWFMAAAAADPVIAAWHELVRQYWNVVRRPHHYYWMEYLFEMLEAIEPLAARGYEAMPKLSAMGPLAVPSHAFDRNPPVGLAQFMDRNRIPAHKLSHKWRYTGPLAELPIGRLTGMARF